MKEVEDTIQADFDEFNNTAYDGFIPMGFSNWFKRAFLSNPPMQHKAPMSLIKSILKKPEGKLTNLEVGIMSNMICAAAPGSIWESTTKAVEGLSEIEKLRSDYNMRTNVTQRELSVKKERLLSLSGVDVNQKNRIFQA